MRFQAFVRQSWRSLTTLSTGLGALAFASVCEAQPHYAMTVVKDAWVGQGQSSNPSQTLACSSSVGLVKPQSKIHSYSSHNQKPIKVLDMTENISVFAIQNTDEGHLNDVNLWIRVKTGQSSTFYEVSRIEMYEYILPKAKLKMEVS